MTENGWNITENSSIVICETGDCWDIGREREWRMAFDGVSLVLNVILATLVVFMFTEKIRRAVRIARHSRRSRR